MGGGNYDRDVYSSSSSSGWGASSYSRDKLSQTTLDNSMNPEGKILRSTTKNPIVVVLDVTGSNINFARVVYDKMPMFFGQIEQKGYLKDFDISFCAVGDAKCDEYPLQVGDFAKGIELDSWLEKVVLEGGGGLIGEESYELAAYYLLKNMKFKKGAKPIIFFIGDEKPYPSVSRTEAEKFGIEYEEDVNPFIELRKKVDDNVFVLLNKLCGKSFRSDFTSCWQKLLAPQHVIKINEEKSIVDLMLGIISMVSSMRTLDTYKEDMEERGQTKTRIANVSESLKDFSTTLIPVKINGDIELTASAKKTTEKGTRL